MKNSFLLNEAVIWPLLMFACGFPFSVHAQGLSDLQTPKEPLVLKAQGSFYVGGESVVQSHHELGSFGPGGSITVNQMYVQYISLPDNLATSSTALNSQIFCKFN